MSDEGMEERVASDPKMLCIIIGLLMDDLGMDEFLVSDRELITGECNLEASRSYERAGTYIRRKQ